MDKDISPDMNTSAPAPHPAADTHTRHEGNVPRKDAELLDVSETVNSKWIADSFFVLKWITQSDFEAVKDKFKAALGERNTAGGERPMVTHDLDNADKKIDDGLSFVKTYILGKFGFKDAPSHYASFGFEHHGHHYEYPTQRQKRLQSLNMMVTAIHANGFDNNQYGLAYWTDLRDTYAQLLGDSNSTSGDISEHVSDLVQLRTKLRRCLHSILLLLEANYPETFDQIRRVWGFQKEKY